MGSFNKEEVNEGSEFAVEFFDEMCDEFFGKPDACIGAMLTMIECISEKAEELCSSESVELSSRGQILADILYQETTNLRKYITKPENVVSLIKDK